MKNHSASDFGKDLGVVHEAVVTGRKAGADTEFWSKLAHDEEFFSKVVKASRGLGKIDVFENSIDLNAEPVELLGCHVAAHKEGGAVRIEKKSDGTYIDGKKLQLYPLEEHLFDGHEGGICIGTGYFEKYNTPDELKDKLTQNGNLLDFLLKKENQHLIPDECSGVTTIFLNTYYRYPGGDIRVRCLYLRNVSEWGDGTSGIHFNNVDTIKKYALLVTN